MKLHGFIGLQLWALLLLAGHLEQTDELLKLLAGIAIFGTCSSSVELSFDLVDVARLPIDWLGNKWGF